MSSSWFPVTVWYRSRCDTMVRIWPPRSLFIESNKNAIFRQENVYAEN